MRWIQLALFLAVLSAAGCTEAPIEDKSETPAAADESAADEPRDPNRLWCGEHGVYEDECLICHPELAARGKSEPLEAATTIARGDVLYCEEHEVFEAECGICHPELLGGLEVGEGLKVRFASIESAPEGGCPGRATQAKRRSRRALKRLGR